MILLTDEEMGDLLCLEKEYTYPCSNGSFTSTVDCRAIAKAQRKKVVEWGGEDCVEHRSEGYLRRECSQCWQTLLRECDERPQS